jgi:hypothetical protein
VKRCLQQVPHLDDPFDTDLAAPAPNAAMRCCGPWNAPATGDPPLDAFEAYVDLGEGQGRSMTPGSSSLMSRFAASGTTSSMTLWHWRGWTRTAQASSSSASMPTAPRPAMPCHAPPFPALRPLTT